MSASIEPILDDVLVLLQERYQASLVLVYGSFCGGTPHERSDIDLLVFGPVPAFVHDASRIASHPLDAWVYPETALVDVSPFLHAWPCRVLLDTKGLGEDLVQRIETAREQRPRGLEPAARKQLEAWLAKMVERAGGLDTEARYRSNWLLHDFPELWCQFRNRYYDGPVKTLAVLREKEPALFALYDRLLASPPDKDQLASLIRGLIQD